MKSRRKRFFKRLFKMAKIPFLIGLGLLFGLIIGSESQRPDIIIQADGRFSENIGQQIGPHLEQQIRERIEDQIVIPPIPDMPEIPALPNIHTNVRIERGPTFWDVLNGIGTLLASMILILMGGKILLQRWRQPKEKSPGSVGA